MPVLINKLLPHDARLLVWTITEDVNWLKTNVILTKEEKDLYNTFTHDHRRKQWLAVRLLLHYYFEGNVNHTIEYDGFGKPYFKESGLSISVSHSHELAGILISASHEIGLDIERLEHRIEKIKHKFLSEEELKMVEGKTANEQLHILWCAKEVMYKIYGRKKLEFKDNLKIKPFSYQEEGKLTGQLSKSGEEMSFDINYRQLNGYILVWGYKV